MSKVRAISQYGGWDRVDGPYGLKFEITIGVVVSKDIDVYKLTKKVEKYFIGAGRLSDSGEKPPFAHADIFRQFDQGELKDLRVIVYACSPVMTWSQRELQEYLELALS